MSRGAVPEERTPPQPEVTQVDVRRSFEREAWRMIVRSLSAALLALSISGAGLPSARAADIAAQRDLVNGGVVGLISGGVTGTYVRIAADLADALDDGYQLRNQNPSPPAPGARPLRRPSTLPRRTPRTWYFGSSCRTPPSRRSC